MTLDESTTSWCLSDREEGALLALHGLELGILTKSFEILKWKVSEQDKVMVLPHLQLCATHPSHGEVQWHGPLEQKLLGWKEDSQYARILNYRGVCLLACISPPEHSVLSISAS